jgi:hypothetical protein
VIPFLRISPSGNDGGLDGFGLYRLRLKALSPILGDRPINDGTAIEALPRIENQKEVREPFQLHKPFALRTLHLIPPELVMQSCVGVEQYSLLDASLGFSMS